MLRPVIAAAENGRRYCFKKKEEDKVEFD